MVELSRYALVLLAAGSSQRMGRAKQLLPVDGRPLLRRAAEACIESGIGTVVVVLGARAGEIQPCLKGLPVKVKINEGWAEGMGSSIKSGIEAVLELAPAAQGVVIALADQPKFSALHIIRLIKIHCETGHPIVASRSAGMGLSPPVFFSPRYYAELRALRGDAGARALLLAHPQEVAVAESDDLGDLDTPDDYVEYLKQQ